MRARKADLPRELLGALPSKHILQKGIQRHRPAGGAGPPAVGGVVTFQPIDAPAKTGRPAGHSGTASQGTVEADGTFTLTALDGTSGAGALVGPHRVIFQPPPTRRPTLSADDRAAMSPEEIRQAEEANSRMPVYPPLPCGDTVSPGEVEVKPRDNEFTFELRPK